MAVRPEGFFHLEAILAMTLFGASPSEKVNPSDASNSCQNVAFANSVALQAGDTVISAARLLGTVVKSMPITSKCGARTYSGLPLF